MDAISNWILVITAAIVVYRFVTRKARRRVVITDFRRGVYFVGGALKGVLEPGSYRYNVRKQEITAVDMRPHPVLIDRLSFQDALRHDGIISVGASLVVRDPSLATTQLRDQINDSYLIVRDAVKTALLQQIAPGRENFDSVQKLIMDAVNSDLAKVGMSVSELEITELWAGTPALHANLTTGVVQ